MAECKDWLTQATNESQQFTDWFDRIAGTGGQN
jgi:hypothetical protein